MANGGLPPQTNHGVTEPRGLGVALQLSQTAK